MDAAESTSGVTLTMPPHVRQRLRRLLTEKRAEALASGLAEKPIAELQASLDEISIYSQLIDIADSAWTRDSVAAAAVALLVLIGAGLLWSLKVHQTNISLAAHADNVHLTLAKQWDMEDSISGADIHLEQLSAAHDPNLDLTLDQAQGNIWLRLEGGNITVASLHIDQSATLSAASGSNLLQLLIGDKPVQGIIQVVGKGVLTAGVSDTQLLKKPFDLRVPETIQFSSPNSGGTATQITVHSPSGWTFGPLACANVGFSYELRPLAERQILSGISSGTLQFSDVAWPTTTLAQNEELSIGRSDTAVTRLNGQSGQIQVVVNGPVGEVTLGGTGNKRRIAPSYLEYFYYKKSLLLFWAVVTAGWGLLWGIRKTIFR